MYRIFLVEDDPIIAETVQQHLMSWGWQVRAATDFSRVMEEFAAGSGNSGKTSTSSQYP